MTASESIFDWVMRFGTAAVSAGFLWFAIDMARSGGSFWIQLASAAPAALGLLVLWPLWIEFRARGEARGD